MEDKNIITLLTVIKEEFTSRNIHSLAEKIDTIIIKFKKDFTAER
mgnify:CR=1 FL=1